MYLKLGQTWFDFTEAEAEAEFGKTAGFGRGRGQGRGLGRFLVMLQKYLVLAVLPY